EAAHRQTNRAADDICFGERRVEHSSLSESTLKIESNLEYSAFPFDRFEILVSAAIGNILAKHQYPFIASHFIVKARVYQVEHCLRSSSVLLFRTHGGIDHVTGIERAGSRIDIR